jgi:NAD(P)-dependent dehydrogenase (short-subunit alcohol dehydrogenase family)
MTSATTGALPATPGPLAGRVAIVTGGSTGVGRGIALALAVAGAAVVVGYHHDADGAAATCARIAANGGQAVACGSDIATTDGAQALVDAAVGTWGRLDVMACHAAITSWSPFLDVSPAALDAIVATNIRGTFLTAQAAARRMVGQGSGGRLLLTASVTGVRAIANLSAYAMTRAAVEALARNLAVELGPHRITVNALVLGPIVNARNLADDPLYAARWGSVLPVGRAGEPADVGAVAAFLATESSSFITGASIPVDGGWIATGQVPASDELSG